MSVLPFIRVFSVFLFLTLVRTGYTNQKRILLTDPQYAHQFEAKLQELAANYLELSSKFNDQQHRISALENSMTMLQQNAKSGGLYVRWGRKTCPLINDTEMVYTGIAGGSYYTHSGAAANHLCMPHDPEFLQTTESAGAYVYGMEYERNFYSNVFDNDVPCAVCRTRRSTVLMLPARQDCYGGWTMEYTGILVAGAYTQQATEYVCLDRHPTTLEHSDADENGALFYTVSSKCGSLPCPPYKNNGILPCVVCTK